MKVLLINGSPNEFGCTYTALKEVSDTLNKNGILTEFLYLGKEAIQSCKACHYCFKNKRCVVDDKVNLIVERSSEFDGIVIGSPVHYASPSGQIISFLDRLFFSSQKKFSNKLGASVVSARRAGTISSFDVLNKYFTISNMPIVSSQYWNEVHGNTVEEVKKDLEGLQTMRTLGTNMAWLLKCIEKGREQGIEDPVLEKRQSTNFIR
ncbi:MAG: flavodoxin family protein [Acholeplasmatales bacterium]|jgi:multimeric flavodoxin WrbA|nr:flavodoxin family protein [Acholeplasmatales bacterium]